MKSTPLNKFLHIGMLVLSWLIFIGLCMELFGLLFYGIMKNVLTPESAGKIWTIVDINALYQADKGWFGVMMLFITIVAALKVVMFYLILQLLHHKTLDLSKPFSEVMSRFVKRLAFLALGIGLFSNWGYSYAEWLISTGYTLPSLLDIKLLGADIWLFMGIVLLVIAHMFKRGMEIQMENELTI